MVSICKHFSLESDKHYGDKSALMTGQGKSLPSTKIKTRAQLCRTLLGYPLRHAGGASLGAHNLCLSHRIDAPSFRDHINGES